MDSLWSQNDAKGRPAMNTKAMTETNGLKALEIVGPYFPDLRETAALFITAAMERLDPLGVEIRPDTRDGKSVWFIMQESEAWSGQYDDWAYDDITFYPTRLEATIAAVIAKEAELRGAL